MLFGIGHGYSPFRNCLPGKKINNTSESSIPGRWRKIKDINQDKNNLTVEQNKMIEQLKSIGYVSGSKPAPERKNVIIYDKNRAYEGLNLVTSGHGPEAILMDMEGNELHKWSCDILRVWPDFKPGKYQRNHTFWRRVHLMENGDLFVIFEGVGMIKLDKNSNLIWSALNGAHHDLYVAQNGNIYILTRKAHINKKYNDDKPILEDFICVLDSNGNQLKQISILEAIENSSYAPILNRLKDWGDVLHTNTIELIENDISHPISSFRKGRLLISILNLDMICLIDFDKGVVWAESDLWARQHQSTMLYNGRILLLDNTGLKNKSRIIELDPGTREIYWQYGGIPDEPFYTPSCGS